jgi:7-keto-8-aminopelargonate synthetase-like enzyme
MLYLDDAHAFGAIGPTGRGTMEALGLPPNPRVVEMATLGKAFGSFGAFVACSPEIKALLTTKARAFVYTTALPPGVCAASLKAVEIVKREPGLVARLQKNATKMRAALNEKGLPVMKGETQIIPLVVGSTGLVMRLSAELLGRGVFIQGIRPPTVPEGSARLRLTVSAAHTDKDMDSAAEVLGRAFAALTANAERTGGMTERGGEGG